MKRFSTLAPAALLLLGLAGNVSAESMSSPRSARMEVVIGQKGNVKLAGTVTGVSDNTMIIGSWGGSWTVDATNAKFTRKAGGLSSLAEMKEGDSVMVTGTMQASGLAVNARVIHNESIHAIASNKVGTVSNVDTGAGTFTLTSRDGKTLAVTTTIDTKFWLGKDASNFAALAGLSATTTVRVDGVINKDAGTVIAHKVMIGIPLAVKPAVKGFLKKKQNLKPNRNR